VAEIQTLDCWVEGVDRSAELSAAPRNEIYTSVQLIMHVIHELGFFSPLLLYHP